MWALLGHFVSAHWEAIIAGALAYLIGIRNPLYCARCRQHFRMESEIRQRMRRGRERDTRDGEKGD